MYPISASVRKNGYVLSFFGLALAIGGAAYTPYILSTYGFVPHDLGIVSLVFATLSPTLAAVALTIRLNGLAGLRELFGGFLRRGFSAKWLLAAFLLPIVICLCALAPWLLGVPSAFLIYSRFDLASAASLPVFFAVSFVLNMWSEVGWRGFAQKRLQNRFSVLFSAFVVGFFWALWQWPLFVVKNSSMFSSYQNPLLFGAFTLLLSVVYAWIYNSTRGSLLAVSLFHASIAAFVPFLFFEGAVAYSVFPYYFGVVLVLALGLMWRFKGSFWVPNADLP